MREKIAHYCLARSWISDVHLKVWVTPHLLTQKSDIEAMTLIPETNGTGSVDGLDRLYWQYVSCSV